MTNLIYKFITKNKNKEKTRESLVFFGGVVGVISNILLAVTKLLIGLLTKSISITADSFNNFSDVASSVVTIIGFKLSSKPPDAEHPFGHGRFEYMSGVVISILILVVGFEFLKSSFLRILNPSKIEFLIIPFIILIISVLVKLWLYFFNKKFGSLSDSSALKAASIDSLSDAIISLISTLSLLLSKFTSFPVDGYIGLAISLFILYSGVKLLLETINPLLGERPDPELIKNIKKEVCKFDDIIGVHDLIIHNYGPNKFMASIHAEVPDTLDINRIHETIDTIEKYVSEKLKIYLVIHMDPINTNDTEIVNARKELSQILALFDNIISFHDFRVVGNDNYKNLIFDIVVKEHDDDISEKVTKKIQEIHPNYNTVITVDMDYESL